MFSDIYIYIYYTDVHAQDHLHVYEKTHIRAIIHLHVYLDKPHVNMYVYIKR